MTGKISLNKTKFPAKAEVFVYVATDRNLLKSKSFQIIDQETKGKLSEKIKLHEYKGKENEIITFELNGFYRYIIITGAGSQTDFNLIKWRNALANAFRQARLLKCSQVTVGYFKDLGNNFFEIGKQLAVSFYLSNYSFDFFRNSEENKKRKKLDHVIFQFDTEAVLDEKKLDEGIKFGSLVAEGIFLTRNLVNQPASHLTPETLVQEAFAIEKESRGKIKVEILDEDECKRLGMGAFLGVAQGSEKKPKFIILHFNNSATQFLSQRTSPSKNRESRSEKIAFASSGNNKKICLIGKSITFDSGGLSLKPVSSMETMKIDMAGGAAVLGVFKILANTDFKNCEVYGLLPACENMPSGKALKPGDVVTAMNKKTVEVVNTDAEGRLALADAICYAEAYIKPDIIIDLATLTGACMVALGKRITGMFGNDKKLLKEIEESAKNQGEDLWTMPLFKPYAKGLKSDIADLKNVMGKGYGGAITAALFLSEFVKKTKWVHLDIAGPAFNDEETHDIVEKGATGWGVLTIMSFIYPH